MLIQMRDVDKFFPSRNRGCILASVKHDCGKNLRGDNTVHVTNSTQFPFDR